MNAKRPARTREQMTENVPTADSPGPLIVQEMEPACPKLDSCRAPLCPLSGQLENCCWYPDEPICRLEQYQGLDWIKKQRLIAKRRGSVDGLFTIKMLLRIRRVRKGIKGIDPGGKPRPSGSRRRPAALRRKASLRRRHMPVVREQVESQKTLFD